jgi:hypothetical protein
VGQYDQSIAAANANLLDQQFTEAQAARDAALRTGTALSSQGATQYGGLFGTLGQSQAGYQQAYSPLFNLLNASQGVGQNDLNRALGYAGAVLNSNRGIDAHHAANQGGGGGVIGTLGGIGGTAVGGYLGGPQGAMAGYTAGSSFGNLF